MDGAGAGRRRGKGPRVLLVASWFPAPGDTTKGRFVADQAVALSQAGAEVAVVSFDTLRSAGAPPVRRLQVAAARAAIESAIASHPREVFSARPWSVDAEIPVARVPVTQAGVELEGPTHKLAARVAVVGPLAGVLEGWRPDIVHAHTIYPDGAAAALLAERLGCSFVVTEHAHFVDAQAAVPEIAEAIAATVGRASAVVCVGRGLQATVSNLAPGAADRIHVLPNPVDLGAFTPAPLEERTADQLLFVGYRAEVKGIDVLLRATARAHAARPTIRLRMIGSAPDPALDARWRQLAGDLGVGDIVSFEPSAMRSAVSAAMESASVLVSASHRETFGIVPIEALAAGLPVVATSTDGVSDTLELVGGPGGRAVGRLVPVADPEALALAILDVLGHRGTFEPTMLRAAVEPHFSFTAVARQLLDLYAAVAGRPPGGLEGSSEAPAGHLPVADGPRPALLVGLDRGRVARSLRSMPEGALRALALVTTDVQQGGRLPAALGAVTVIDQDAAFREAVASTGVVGTSRSRVRWLMLLARHPVGTVRRWQLRGRRTGMREAAVRSGLQTALAAAGTAAVVAHDAADLLELSRLDVEPGRVLPGSLRWLADRVAPGARSSIVSAVRRDASRAAADATMIVREPRLRVGVYSPSDLNVIDGSAIWLESTTSTIAAIAGADVRLLLRAPETRDVVTRRLRLPNVRLVRPRIPLADPSGRAQPVEAVEAMEIEDELERLDLLVLRGYDACWHAVRRGRFSDRLVAAYILEPERDSSDPGHQRRLSEIVERSAAVAVQTPEMGELLADLIPAAADKLLLLPPAVPPEQLSLPRWDRADRLFYVGKFHAFYAVDRIVEALIALRSVDPNLTLEVAGDKFSGTGPIEEDRQQLEALLRSTPGVAWHGGLARDAVLEMLRTGGIAVSLWDYRHGSRVNDLVVSTKLLDYCAAGLPAIVTPTTVLRRLLGDDYPGFNPSVDGLQDTIAQLLRDQGAREEAARRTVRVAQAFSYDVVADQLVTGLRRLGLLGALGAAAAQASDAAGPDPRLP